MKKYVITGMLFLLFSSLLMNYQGYQLSLPELTQAKNEVHPYGDLQGYDDILELQNAFIRNAKIMKTSVVSINNLKEIHTSALHSEAGNPVEDVSLFHRLRNWFNSRVRRQYQLESLGSGILYTSNGYILTNYHVVEDIDQILVKLSDGRDFNAKIIGIDPKTDIAVIKIFSFLGFPALPLGTSNKLEVGEWVMAIGNPFGLEGTVTVGVVSGIQRSDLGITTYENFIQTDASINPGNSGGPLINLNGEVVGINTAVAEIGAGVGFAIPIEMAIDIANQLIETGEVQRGWLGVGIQPLTPELAETFKVVYSGGCGNQFSGQKYASRIRGPEKR